MANAFDAIDQRTAQTRTISLELVDRSGHLLGCGPVFLDEFAVPGVDLVEKDHRSTRVEAGRPRCSDRLPTGRTRTAVAEAGPDSADHTPLRRSRTGYHDLRGR